MAAGGGLLLGFHLAACNRREESLRLAEDSFSPNSWIHIAPDESVILMLASSEMGQGVMTALPIILADELEADWSRVRVEFAPVHPDFNNPLSNTQQTGGSTSVRGYWKPLRLAGAAARELLVKAAAKTWNVPVAECRAHDGKVTHEASKRTLTYGGLLTEAARLQPPESPRLKDPAEFRRVGQIRHRLDTPLKINGSAVFGQDVHLPGLLTAVVARCPVSGGRLKNFDATSARAVHGVRHVAVIDAGVAVAADNYWAARRGREALITNWDLGPLAKLNSDDIYAGLRAAIEREGNVTRNDGDALTALSSAPHVIDAIYETPYLAHACMEPMNCTADVRSDGCDVWVPTQAQTEARDHTARITGLPASSVHIHTTFLGGGFGRRLQADFLIEAVTLSKAIGKPVKVLWTREEDIRHGSFRPANCARLRARIDASGNPNAWFERVAGPEHALGGIDIPYEIPNLRVETVKEDPGVPSGPWRSVGASQNAFGVESFIDELAHFAGQDPLNYRLRLLKSSPRHVAVLKLAADKAGWGAPLPYGHGRGIAVYSCYGGWVAHVVDVVVSDGRIRVERVVSAVDCGTVISPDGVVAQTESAVAFALTAALKGEITHRNGQVVQSNFRDYGLLRMDEMPLIEVHIVPSRADPGGVGEAGVPPLAPALTNAIFAATGKRILKLPIHL